MCSVSWPTSFIAQRSTKIRRRGSMPSTQDGETMIEIQSSDWYCKLRKDTLKEERAYEAGSGGNPVLACYPNQGCFLNPHIIKSSQ